MTKGKKRKRGQNEGTIYQRKDGRWAAGISLGYQNGKLKRKSFYGKTRDEVQKSLTKALHDHQAGLPVALPRQTLEQFLDRWLIDCVKPSVRPKTFASYSQLVKLHINPQLGRLPLSKLGPEHVQRFLNDRLAVGAIRKKETDPIKGLSPRTVQYLRAVLRRALGEALKWGLIGRNVATLVDAPRTVKHAIHPMTAEETKLFLAKCNGNRLEALFTVALAMGLRQGEALGLRWEDVDWKSRVLHVRHSLQRINKKLVLSELKSESSRRDLPLIDVIAAGLRAHRSRQLAERLAAGKDWQESGFVFTTTIGTPLDARNVVRNYHETLTGAGIPLRRFHDLRHGCATLLLAQGVPLKTVSDILGHSQISITADIYAHVVPEMRRDAFGVMERLLAAGK
jgi:integrase